MMDDLVMLPLALAYWMIAMGFVVVMIVAWRSK